jgi:WD40 repeat protein
MDIFPILISGAKSYRLVSSTDKKTGVHSRIIWCCSWTRDSRYFITGSRDGKVAVWGHQSATSETESPLGQYTLTSKPLELPNQSVTALAVAPVKIAPLVYLVAVGLENGCINMYKWSSISGESGDNWQTCLQLNNSYPFCSSLMINILHMCIFFIPSLFPRICGAPSNQDLCTCVYFLKTRPC